MEEQLKREIAISKKMNHPHIVQMREVFKTRNHINIVLEFVTGGELFDRIGMACCDHPTATANSHPHTAMLEHGAACASCATHNSPPLHSLPVVVGALLPPHLLIFGLLLILRVTTLHSQVPLL